MRGRNGYDDNHPDEHLERNTPLLFLWNGRPVGAVRLDQDNGNALGIVRLVAVLPENQRRGIGTAMIEAVEAFATTKGMKRLKTQAANDAVIFYEKLGWHVIDTRERNTLMIKDLA